MRLAKASRRNTALTSFSPEHAPKTHIDAPLVLLPQPGGFSSLASSRRKQAEETAGARARPSATTRHAARWRRLGGPERSDVCRLPRFAALHSPARSLQLRLVGSAATLWGWGKAGARDTPAKRYPLNRCVCVCVGGGVGEGEVAEVGGWGQ